MVHDLAFESHPGKALEEHIRGVQKGTLLNSNLRIAEYAALFHDFGKINPNFQNKLYGKSSGYANHSYLSVIAWVNFAIANMKALIKENAIPTNEEFSLFVLQVAVLIAKHHNHLPNLENAFSDSQELKDAVQFASENNKALPISEFLGRKLTIPHETFELGWDKKRSMFVSFTSKYQKKAWKQNPLLNFMDARDAFAAIIEADKRDAGKLSERYFNTIIDGNSLQLNDGLSKIFAKFETSPNPSELNKLRTIIRIEAVDGVKKALTDNKRIFTLTAPTGAGKTYTLLSVANEIRKQRGNLGIIYALPFLSITEQVQKIAEDLMQDVLPVNSKAENERISNAQKIYENDQSDENLKRILAEDFIQHTFDHPFVITTFVQFFETLVSNRNATLLKLPNFANRIFLIDEVQALPPRLYIFFAAWLEEFCKRNNSYAVLSTATMPKLGIPIKETEEVNRADLLFKTYQTPKDLLDCRKFFDADIFNRYTIEVIKEKQTKELLADHILQQDSSCLVILNTIADTKELYQILLNEAEHLFLLNTYFIPDDRSRIIKDVQNLLGKSEKVILISTQLIEAGVDIDFPIVYRDMCPLPSLIQSAGRCNRNKKLVKGLVYFFELTDDKGRSRANLIYRNEGKMFLDFCKNELSTSIDENQLFDVQSRFFESIQRNLTIGEFRDDKGDSYNMVKCINKAEFENLGKFQLISKDIGKQVQYYILENDEDYCFESLGLLIEELKQTSDYAVAKRVKIQISDFIKQISGRILNVRVNKFNESQMPTQFRADIMGIKFISNDNYSPTEGLILANVENCFL